MRFLFLSVLLSLAMSGMGQIKISAQKDVDFSKYKTFVVQKGQTMSSSKEKRINENKLYEVLQESIAREMAQRGFLLAEDSTAQLTISYFYEESDQSSYEKPGPLGQTPTQDPTYVNEPNRSIVARTLVIEIENRKKNSLWTATCNMEQSQKNVYTLIDMTVAAAFRKFKSGKK